MNVSLNLQNFEPIHAVKTMISIKCMSVNQFVCTLECLILLKKIAASFVNFSVSSLFDVLTV